MAEVTTQSALIFIYGLTSRVAEEVKTVCERPSQKLNLPLYIHPQMDYTYIYTIPRLPECLPLRPYWLPLTPHPQANVSPPLEPKGGGQHLLAGEGVGGANSILYSVMSSYARNLYDLGRASHFFSKYGNTTKDV